MANGIAEAIRNYSMTITPRAMFSRAVSGIRNNTVIINLPGSPKAVKESLEFLLPNLEHGLGILTNRENECGAPCCDAENITIEIAFSISSIIT